MECQEITGRYGALSLCLEKPVVPVGNQMERAFPLEIFRKKRNTFRGIPLFSKILTGFSKQMESAQGWVAKLRSAVGRLLLHAL